VNLLARARPLVPDPAYRAYRALRVRRYVDRFVPREVEHRYGDTRLRLTLRDPLAAGWYDHDWDDPPEVRVLREHGLGPGARVFDLGAHQGVVALMLARAVAPGGAVVALEAQPHNARMAEENRRLNDADNLHVIHAAAATTGGTVLVSRELNARVLPGRRVGKIAVPSVSVDQLADRHGAPDFMLIDVEGYELAVLEGAARTLSKHRPTVVVEVHAGIGLEDAGGSVERIVAVLRGHDYRLDALRVADGSAGTWSTIDDGVVLPREHHFLLAR
jgi:FkbM family methyltransferase